MTPEQLAINSISTRHASLEEALDAYAGAGFTNVELHLPLAKPHGADVTLRLLKERSLRSIGGFESALACFGSSEERDRSLRLLAENARFLHELGGGVLVLGTDGPAQPSRQSLAIVAGALVELAESLDGLAVELALEFNWGPLVRSLESAVAVAREAAHPGIGVLFDPAHYRTTVTKLEHLTAENVRWIKHVHFNDMNATPGDLADCNADRVLPGEGVLELPLIIDALERGGYDRFFSVELFSEELWQLPAAETADRCYTSSLKFCGAA